MESSRPATLAEPDEARNLLRSFVEERYPASSWQALTDEPLLPGGAWVLKHEGGFSLLRVPDIKQQTIISVRAGAAIEIPRSAELAYYVACENKQIMAGRAFMGYGDEFALVVVEEIVWGRALSWSFEPGLSDMLTRFEYVLSHAQAMQSTILERFGGRPFRDDEWFLLQN
jgi:hypothetical protein